MHQPTDEIRPNFAGISCFIKQVATLPKVKEQKAKAVTDMIAKWQKEAGFRRIACCLYVDGCCSFSIDIFVAIHVCHLASKF